MNYLYLASGPNGIVIDKGVFECTIINPRYSHVTNEIIDNGFNTVILDDKHMKLCGYRKMAGENIIPEDKKIIKEIKAEEKKVTKNLLSNPSFEEGRSLPPSAWEWDGKPNKSTTFVEIVSPGYDTNNAIKFVDQSTTDGPGITQFFEPVVIISKKTYRASFYKKGGPVILQINWYSADGTFLKADPKYVKANESYEYFALTAKSAKNTGKIVVKIYITTTDISTCFFDCVTLEEIK